MLPARGTCAYNSYTFNGTAKTRMVGRPVKSRDGRTITHVDYTLTVEWFLYDQENGLSCANQMILARRSLQAPRKRLQYLTNGFGDLDVNGADAAKQDLRWGPQPSEVQYEVVGHGQIWKCIWYCTFSVSECSSLSLNALSVMGFGYGAKWSFDETGYCTRTITGYVQTPGYVRANGTWGTADDLRDLIQVQIPLGFRRAPREFTLSDDRTTLDFTITDVEIPAESLPDGCTEADGMYDVSNMNPRDLSHWNGRFSCNYTVSPDRPRRDAWDAFWALVIDRIQWNITQNQQRGQGNNKPLLTSFRIGEGLYKGNRRMTFDLSFMFTADLKNMMIDSGMWRPVPHTDSRHWASSVGSILGNRGLSDLRFDAAGDIIINLCDVSANLRTPNEPNNGPVLHTEDAPGNPQMKTEGYIRYQNRIDLKTQSGYIATRLLTNSDARFNRSMTARTDSSGNPVLTTDPSSSPPPGVPQNDFPFVPPTPTAADVESVQARVVPGQTARLRGYAVRVGKPAPPPKLLQVGDSPAIPSLQQHFDQMHVGFVMGVPMFYSEWNLPYSLPDVTGGRRDSRVPLYGMPPGSTNQQPAQWVLSGPLGVPALPDIYNLPFDPQ